MSRIKAWLMTMEEDAESMSAQEFAKEHGQRNMDIWSKIQRELGKDNTDEQYLAFCKTQGEA